MKTAHSRQGQNSGGSRGPPNTYSWGPALGWGGGRPWRGPSLRAAPMGAHGSYRAGERATESVCVGGGRQRVLFAAGHRKTEVRKREGELHFTGPRLQRDGEQEARCGEHLGQRSRGWSSGWKLGGGGGGVRSEVGPRLGLGAWGRGSGCGGSRGTGVCGPRGLGVRRQSAGAAGDAGARTHMKTW